MTDHDALLRAIGEQPEEDTPRLAYADWLEENDQPERADFVRNQIALAQPGLTAADRRPLVVKNVRYLRDWVPHWRNQLPRLAGVEWGDFRRGLIEEVLAQNEGPIAAHAADIFAVPGVHILRLWRLTNGRALAAVRELERLRSLRLVAARAEPRQLLALLNSDHLGRLQVLDLHGNRADDDVAEALAGGRFPDLVELWLGSNLIGPRGARALAASQHLNHVRVLDLQGNNVDAPARAALLTRFGSKLKV